MNTPATTGFSKARQNLIYSAEEAQIQKTALEGKKVSVKTAANFNKARGQSQQLIQEKPAFIRRPRTLICYICGREYGTASLQIHLKTCIKKFEMEESYKPAHLRRPVPRPPQTFEDMQLKGSKGGFDVDQFNQEAFKKFNDEALVPCEHCHRTFLPDRLEVHKRICLKVFMRKVVPKNFRLKRMVLPGEVVTLKGRLPDINRAFSMGEEDNFSGGAFARPAAKYGQMQQYRTKYIQ
ncbi:hypothetical protein FGO68_gene14097 [Halteria grandinella]|uniref:C2HC/C3H-type domain-containing protein n=1 Tax=Halteria grandinella TaxID=5974 RepID=A0A8J8NNR5_HALGN|nr:hypothetical protein FGO68_gene14097 [Halteria grandinella]